ncbi:MAG TPA: class I adenylate-forming enzyme family protein [Solirubrobacterales bacterium]|nr:class I adenylate-forming enzyme family protein [Solirubrobacterales bacterium]
MTGSTIGTVFDAPRDAAAPAVRGEEREASYGEIGERSGRLAAGLLSAGAVPGDRIAVLCRNSVESVEIFFAAAQIGAVVVPIEIGLRGLEVDFQLRESQARWLFADWSGWEVARDLVGIEPMPQPVAVGAELWTRAGRPVQAYEDLLAADAGSVPRPGLDPGRPLLLRFALDAAGLPRAWSLTEAELLAGARGQIDEFGITADSVYLSAPGRSWAADAYDLGIACWLAGGVVRLAAPRRFDVADYRAELVFSRATHALLSSSQLRILACSESLAGGGLDRLRTICVAARGPVGDVMPAAAKTLPSCRIVQVLCHAGLGGTAAVLEAADAAPDVDRVGRAAIGFELAAISADGEPLAPGETGEVACRAVGEERWLALGDLGHLESDGHLVISERIAETISCGGLDVCLAEVEATLCEHEAIAEIALVAVPDARLGEATEAHVVARPDRDVEPELLAEYARDRLASYKVPTGWVLHSGPLPRAGGGRFEKSLLTVATVGSMAA